METLQGTSAKSVGRQLDCWLDEEGRVAFWIHSLGPKPNNASEIHLDPRELLQALIRLCVTPAGLEPSHSTEMPREDQVITQARIDELLRFLPLFDVPDKEFVAWKGGEQKDGVITMPYPIYPVEVEEFFRLASQRWWDDCNYEPAEASEMLGDDVVVSVANLSQMKTLLTYCVRGERFCDGLWGELLRSGRIIALLRRLQQLRDTVR